VRSEEGAGHRPPGLIARSDGFRLRGRWTLEHMGELEQYMGSLSWSAAGPLTLDASELEALDTSGALVLNRLRSQLEGKGLEVRLKGLGPDRRTIYELVRDHVHAVEAAPRARRLSVLARLGRWAWSHVAEAYALICFVGESAVALLRSAVRPARIRWRALLSTVETAGVDAVPIIGMLSFLMGVVIAYQGGLQLERYGANIFIVELVSLTMIRELAPLLTAIIVAGRTGSAFTAEIGTMKITEEVDALRTLGIDPMELLVLPKALGLLVALPLLSVFADVMGLLGGMVMAQFMLGVGFGEFVDRLPDAISLTSFILGVGKAPVFAAIIALVGCYRGFRAGGSADDVGRQTTASVVQAIFLVIVFDALFSVLFGGMGI